MPVGWLLHKIWHLPIRCSKTKFKKIIVLWKEGGKNMQPYTGTVQHMKMSGKDQFTSLKCIKEACWLKHLGSVHQQRLNLRLLNLKSSISGCRHLCSAKKCILMGPSCIVLDFPVHGHIMYSVCVCVCVWVWVWHYSVTLLAKGLVITLKIQLHANETHLNTSIKWCLRHNLVKFYCSS